MTKPYHFDLLSRTWTRGEGNGFAYSDGDAVENSLLDIIRNASDKTTNSSELAGSIKDWPTEYHLSSARANILRPFFFTADHKILEFGCGCGAITRHLGESGAMVVAVEGSARRAGIASARCADLANVVVYRDNLIDFTSDEKFDYVTLVGVLEYARCFVSGDDPVGAVLRHARTFLKEGGTLILAIENQLGLKYFNGCQEDHVGLPYIGINGLYRPDGPVTFGRKALARHLDAAGFSSQEFYYPFPDYKLAEVILNDAALPDSRFNCSDFLLSHAGRNRPEDGQRAFDEGLAWRAAIDNGLLPDLANSFLVSARIAKAPRPTSIWLAVAYGKGRRRPCYQVETIIFADAANALSVRKRKLHPAASVPENQWLSHSVGDSRYLPGKLPLSAIHAAMARGADIDALAACFKPWLAFLRGAATEDETGRWVLPQHFVDCIPANILLAAGGEVHFFDSEWHCPTPVPMAWIVVRGILNALIDTFENPALSHLSYRQLIDAIAGNEGISLSDEDYIVAAKLEHNMLSQCLIQKPETIGLGDFLNKPVGTLICLSSAHLQLKHAIAEREREIARVKSSVSWRLTKPLRAIWNLSRRLLEMISPQSH